MKKVFFKIVALLSAFALTACDFTLLPTDGGVSQDGSENTSNSEVISGSSATTSGAKVTSVKVEDNKDYSIGDSYSISGIAITAYYDDGSEEIIASSKATLKEIRNPSNQVISNTSKFNQAGEYKVKYDVNVNGKKYSTTTNFNVASGFDSEGFTVSSIEYAVKPSFHKGEVVKTLLHDISLLIHWNRGDEYYTYDISTDTTGIAFSLKQQGDDVTERIEEELTQGNTYTLTLSFGEYNLNYQFTIYGNYYQLDSGDITYTQTDLESIISPSKGNVKMLIVPIILKGNYIDEWTTARLSEIDGYYFGEDTSKMSLKMYYETASFGQMNVSGTVVDPYTENSETLTSDLIEADDSYNKLFTLIANAVSWIKSAHPEINLDEYDLNDDGAIDNIHLITNFNTETYSSQTGNQVWSTPLWPHKYQTGNTGTKLSPVANVYSISAIDHVYDCVTAVHEQGHIFGLPDYYNYGNDNVDYIGHADMQSANIFDWNSYSKFSVGWISPYVVTGDTEITLGAASLTGDCLVIPANPSTFNNSAFDEYFLIELFSPYGNNAVNYPYNGNYGYGNSWEFYSTYCGDLGSYGVRLYHVSSQIYKWGGSSFLPIDTGSYTGSIYFPTDNNQYDYDRWSYYADYADQKLLSIIQQGGVDTFGSTESGARKYLNGDDLFHQGDVFTFNQYKHLLSKTGAEVTTMDNGETFPYKITFTAMSATSVTIKIETI